MKKCKKVTKIVISVTLIGLLCCGCSSTANSNVYSVEQSDSSAPAKASGQSDSSILSATSLDQITVMAFSDDFSNLVGDVTAAKTKLYEICQSSPDVLAAVLSAFPQAINDHGVAIPDCTATFASPWKIDETLVFGENGGKLQEELLAIMQDILADPDTQFEFTEVSGWQDMLLFLNLSGSEKLTPETLQLISVRTYCNQAPQFVITATYADGSTDTGQFDLHNGFARTLTLQAQSSSQ